MATTRTPKAIQLVDTRLLIQESTAYDAGELGFVARMQAQFGLPYKDLGPDVHVYTRKNGRGIFRVVSGVGIPYGTLPRLLLAFTTSEAVRTKSPYIELGRNVSIFLRDKLGLYVTGGEKGYIPRLKLQAHRLFSSQISVTNEYQNSKEGNLKARFMNMSDSIDLSWWTPNNSDVDATWESTIQLSGQFYESVTSAPVPVDWRAISALKGSALALDLYFWLTYRYKYLKEVTRVPYFGEYGLYHQLGSNVKDNHRGRNRFKEHVEDALKQVVAVYPDARIETNPNGLILKPSKTHVIAFTTPAAALAENSNPPTLSSSEIHAAIADLAQQKAIV